MHVYHTIYKPSQNGTFSAHALPGEVNPRRPHRRRLDRLLELNPQSPHLGYFGAGWTGRGFGDGEGAICTGGNETITRVANGEPIPERRNPPLLFRKSGMAFGNGSLKDNVAYDLEL